MKHVLVWGLIYRGSERAVPLKVVTENDGNSRCWQSPLFFILITLFAGDMLFSLCVLAYMGSMQDKVRKKSEQKTCQRRILNKRSFGASNGLDTISELNVDLFRNFNVSYYIYSRYGQSLPIIPDGWQSKINLYRKSTFIVLKRRIFVG